MAKLVNDTKVITNKVRFSYVHVFEPWHGDNDPERAKYQAVLLIPKDDKETLDFCKQAIENAKAIGRDKKWGGKIPKNLDIGIRDGDEKDLEESPEYEGCYYVSAKSSSKPAVVDAFRAPITNTEDFYSGCYGRASIVFYPYKASGNVGIGVGLNNVQKLQDGDPLGGRKASADVDFDDDYADDYADDPLFG